MDPVQGFVAGISIVESWQHCDKLMSSIEDLANKNDLSEQQMKNLLKFKLPKDAFDLIDVNADRSWNDQRQLLMDHFVTKLSIREKVELRKNLFQKENESINDFYNRCIDAQYVISDNEKDVAFDREVLLHFLFGLVSRIRDMVLNADCSTPEEYINEARKYFQGVKEEPVGCNVDIKLETDFDQDAFQNENEFIDHEDMYFGDELDNDYESDMKLESESLEEEEDKNCQDKIDNIKAYFCALCSKHYTSKLKFQKHNQYKHPKHKQKPKEENDNNCESELKCQHCPAEFDNVAARIEHEEKIHDPISRICSFCKQDFETYNLLAAHVAYKHCHRNELGKLVCIICSSFQRKNKKDVKKHILRIHLKCPSQLCKICNKEFDRIGILEEHMRTAHTEGKSYQCDKCEKSFKGKKALWRHYVVFHEKQTIQKCKVEGCDKTFPNSVKLSVHIYQDHTKESFVCDHCGKDFKQKDSLRLHTIREHTSQEEQEKLSFKCQEPGCEFTAFRRDLVAKHVKCVHLKIKNFQCPHCDDAFAQRYRLEEHVNGVHLGKKPHKCDLCGFCTAYRNVHKEHKKVAHGNQRFDCPYCSHSAKYKGNLTKHMRSVHKRDI